MIMWLSADLCSVLKAAISSCSLDGGKVSTLPTVCRTPSRSNTPLSPSACRRRTITSSWHNSSNTTTIQSNINALTSQQTLLKIINSCNSMIYWILLVTSTLQVHVLIHASFTASYHNVSRMRLSLSSGDQLFHTAAFPNNRADTSFILSVLYTCTWRKNK